MIPEQLRLRNFLSHRETDVDLRGIHLASLVGENGAGKSALLDAITWAVWGRSRAPYGREDDLVYHGESALEVEFTFRMPYQTGAEERCRIMRRREERGRRAVSSLLDFEVETADGWRILTADSIRETQQTIIDHLGLDYDTFINSAYLRQGHADEFTVQPPAQRKHVLSTVLGLDRWAIYQDRAKTALASAQGQMRELDRRLSETEVELARRPAFEADLETAQREATALDDELAGVQQTMDELTRLREQALALQQQREDATRRLAEVDSELARLQSETTERQARRDYYLRLVEQGDAIQSRYQAYQAVVAEEREYGEKLSQAARLQGLRAAKEAEIAAEREALLYHVRAAEQDEVRLDRAIADARARLERALGELRTQDVLLRERFADERLAPDLLAAEAAVAEIAAAAEERERVRAALQENEVEQGRLKERNRQLREAMDEIKGRSEALNRAEADCPLCGQPLSADHRQELLAGIEAQGGVMGDEYRANREVLRELEVSQAALNDKGRGLDSQLRTRQAREKALARLQQQAEQAEAAHERSAALAAQMTVLEAQIASGAYVAAENAALAEAQRRKRDLQARIDAQDYAPEARAGLATLLAQVSALGYDAAAHEGAKAQVMALRDAEGDLRDLEKARVGVEGESQTLLRLEEQVALQRERAAALVVKRSTYETALAELEPLLAEAPIVARRLVEVRQMATAARQRVGAAKQNLAALDTLAQRIDGMRQGRASLAEQVAIHTELREAFGVNGIPAMIIEHALPELERDANRILQQLTRGRMHIRFDTQRETKTGNLRETLDIIISDEKGTRPYESFSGGEQFRINFAIRVALSRMLAQRAGVRLRSLFVDEGFGSLDADGRQRLVEAVKAVEGEFDMILVITHIDELRDAFPTQIQVTKTDSGSQVDIL
ncbi:MAG: SMC family ATPase [Anaerolineae bacterium]|nr:SMC family ATPase [Anaerolineae bacterium]